MDKLWAPWRVNYITSATEKTKGCIFCQMLKKKDDHQHLIFTRTEHCFAVLNLYPYNNGHALILPYRHVNDLSKLKPEELADFIVLLNSTKTLLDRTLSPQGYNIGMNIGKAAGAGVPGHIHIHIVPRWKGDVNFMPVTADTKVISQSLRELFDLLVKAQQDKRIK